MKLVTHSPPSPYGMEPHFSGWLEKLKLRKERSTHPPSTLELFTNHQDRQNRIQKNFDIETPVRKLLQNTILAAVFSVFPLMIVPCFQIASEEAKAHAHDGNDLKGFFAFMGGFLAVLGSCAELALVLSLFSQRKEFLCIRQNTQLFLKPIDDSDPVLKEHQQKLHTKIDYQAEQFARYMEEVIAHNPQVKIKEFFKDFLKDDGRIDKNQVKRFFEGKAVAEILGELPFFDNVLEKPIGETEFLTKVLAEMEGAWLMLSSTQLAKTETTELKNIGIQETQNITSLLSQYRALQDERESLSIDEVVTSSLKNFKKLTQRQYQQQLVISKSLQPQLTRLQEQIACMEKLPIPFILTSELLAEKLMEQNKKVQALESEASGLVEQRPSANQKLLQLSLQQERKKLNALEEKYQETKIAAEETTQYSQKVIGVLTQIQQLILSSKAVDEPPEASFLKQKDAELDLEIKLVQLYQELEEITLKQFTHEPPSSFPSVEANRGIERLPEETIPYRKNTDARKIRNQKG